jgi:dipeptidyl aminopeptidase/acylaminoacyl peptidase
MPGAGNLVVSPNPRGSTSSGNAFTAGCLGDWGGGDWRDILAALDKALELSYADSSRTGIYGYSYGSYIASWAIGQTDRFKAAVIGAPMTHVHKAVTPSLILHPEEDQRCPIGQSEQLFIGLLEANVPTEFIR